MGPPEKASAELGSERAILYFTCAAHALTHMYMMLFTALLHPMRASFQLGVAEFTYYASISTLLFGLGSLPTGWLGDRIGEKRMLVAFYVLSALGGTVLGLAHDRFWLAVGMATLGLGASIFHPVGNAMIARGIRRPGRAMGINGLFGSLGTAAGPFLAGEIAYHLGWRYAYLVLTPVTLLLGIALSLTHLRLPPATGTRSTGNGAPNGHFRFGGYATLLSLLLVAMTCGGFSYHVITTMLPTYLAANADGAGTAGLRTGAHLSALLYAIGGLGQLLAGHMVHSRDGRGLYVVILTAALPLLFVTGKLSGAPVLACGSVMAVFLFAVQPIENVLLSRYAKPSNRGLVFGLKFILAFGVGGGLGTRLSGVVAERYGTSEVFTAAAVVTAAALCCALLARAQRRSQNQ